MPRPNPPRKRPRRRPGAAKADADLTRQTAQSAQPRPQSPSPKQQQPQAAASGGGGSAGAAAAAIQPEELWSRRSYAILVALIAATEVVIGLILFGLAPPPKDIVSLIAEMLGLQPFQPFPLLAACLLAAPVARRIAHEARPLRFVETLIVGVVIYFLFIVFVTAAGFLLSPPGSGGSSNGCGTTSGAPATPLPNGTSPASSSPSGTPCPSPSPSGTASPGAQPSASPASSASASPGATIAGTTGTSLSPAAVLTAAGGSYAAAYGATVFVYPPLYRRLRVRPRPPSSDGRGSAGGDKGGKR